MHPCQKCGACCAVFRVSFHWSETLPESFGVPVELTAVTSPHLLSMRGTETSPVRCIALRGEVGKNTGCSIYGQRSSTCRNFKASYEDGLPHATCDQARAAAGMPRLGPADWLVVPAVLTPSADAGFRSNGEQPIGL